MTGRSGHFGPLTAPAPRPAHPPVQRVVEVVGRRPVNAYVELTLAAPEIAERAEPGQFVAFAIGGETSALLLRRSIAIAGSRRRRRHRRGRGARARVDLAGRPAGRGSGWTSSARSAGRSRPRRTAPGRCWSAVATAPRRWSGLAARLRARGHEVAAVAGAASADRLCSVEELSALADPVEVTTDDGSAGRTGRVTVAVDELLPDVGVVYACGPMAMLRAVADAATARGVPSYVAVEESMACGIGVCMTCVLPVVGEDGRTRFSRSCVEGPVFGGDRVRFDDVGKLPHDVVGADAMGVVAP